ncbi:uncharacterized protein LOC130668206 [Microplitis mediator]|uniref:uncharacterized protein LOC130668206 n=1 Tax=Microplitis mediator TaxID=375433 RepID=UPI0025528AB8|nr:uncharacterized protein LOC130668206 [Microplitis mediator]
MNAAITTSIVLLLVTWGQCCSHGGKNQKEITGRVDDRALSSAVVLILKEVDWPVDTTYADEKEYYGSIVHPKAVLVLSHPEFLLAPNQYTAIGGCPQVLNIDNNSNLEECQRKSISRVAPTGSTRLQTSMILILKEKFTMNDKINVISLAKSAKEVNSKNCYAFATTYLFNDKDTHLDYNALLMAVYKVNHTEDTVLLHQSNDGDFVHVHGGNLGYQHSAIRVRNVRSSPIVCERTDAPNAQGLISVSQIGFLNMDLWIADAKDEMDVEVEESSKKIYTDVPKINEVVSQIN